MSPAVRRLNRRVHIWAGLALLLFVALFAATGLLLNHHWAFAEFWETRQVQTSERRLDAAAVAVAGDDVATARRVLDRLGLAGEVQSVKTRPDAPLEIQAGRPGEMFRIEADLRAGRARVERTTVNGWGVVRSLHTFVGVSENEPARRRDWWLTRLWSLAIDGAAIGLILLAVGGLIEAWAANPRRLPLVLAFAAGALACAAFVAGLVA